MAITSRSRFHVRANSLQPGDHSGGRLRTVVMLAALKGLVEIAAPGGYAAVAMMLDHSVVTWIFRDGPLVIHFELVPLVFGPKHPT